MTARDAVVGLAGVALGAFCASRLYAWRTSRARSAKYSAGVIKVKPEMHASVRVCRNLVNWSPGPPRKHDLDAMLCRLNRLKASKRNLRSRQGSYRS